MNEIGSWWSEFCDVVRGTPKPGYPGWEPGAPWGLGKGWEPVLQGGQRKVNPAWGGGGWENPTPEGTCPAGATVAWTDINCEFQESSVEMNLIFLQMRKGALREEKPGWALTSNFQAL